MNGTITLTYKWARRIAISLIGGTVLLVGLAMVVLPGPALVVIPLGLGILGLEFAWARRWLRRAKERAQQLVPGFAGSAPHSPALVPGRTAHQSAVPSSHSSELPPGQPPDRVP